MHRIIQEQNMAALIAKEIAGTLNEQERDKLRAWLAASEENRQFYSCFQEMQLSCELERYQQIRVREGWTKYQQRYNRKSHFTLVHWASIAAAAIIVAGLGLWLTIHRPLVSEQYTAIQPGSSKAILVLDNGTSRYLAELKGNELQNEGLTVQNDGKILSYKAPDQFTTKEKKTVYNELRIPRGGEYQLVLADGTHVWLNSETTLRYPVRFNNSSREVFLQGEAFFEVAKDKAHPFIVHTQDKVNVQVLGTSFNVRAFEEDKQVQVVLEKGAVQMQTTDQEVVLKPGDKASYDLTARNLDISPVNTKIYTEWRNGQFIFIRKRVEDIFTDLARWYNIEVYYRQEAVKNVLFSGSLKRYDTIQPLLDAIEIAGGIRFEIQGNTLFIDAANP